MSTDLREQLQGSLGGGYRLSRELGGGGMAKVFVADDATLGRRVVVKVLSPDLAAGVNLERFRREIQVAARLHHPRIVPVLSAGDVDDVVYYTMPFIDGMTLRTLIESERQLSVGRALAIAGDVAEALEYAHAANIVHRDIKPENILIDGATGRALVTDFGIARAIERAADLISVTTTGLTLGTPTYMSPEQASAEKHVDGRSDIYSLGCVLYEMLAGVPPFAGTTARAIIARHLTEPPPPIRVVRPDLSPGVERIIATMLAKSPAARFPTARELLDALAHPDDPTVVPAAPRRLTGVHLGLGLAAAALVVGALAVFRAGRSPGDALSPAHIAVLPFETPPADTQLATVGRWLGRDLSDALARSRGLTVISSAGVERVGVHAPLDSIARQLRVGTIVTGALERRGADIDIEARLVRGAGLAERGSVRVRYPLATLVRMRDTLVGEVASALRRRLGPDVQLSEWRGDTRSDEAWRARQRAEDVLEYETEMPRRAGDAAARLTLFGRADSLLAAAATADDHWLEPVVARGWIRVEASNLRAGAASAATVDTGLAFAARALARDPQNARALALRGALRYKQWSTVSALAPGLLDSAERDLVEATSADPGNARAWIFLSSVLRMKQDVPAAVRAVRRAIEADAYLRDLPRALDRLIFAYLFAGEADSARVLCREQSSRYSADPGLGMCELNVLGWSGRGTADIARVWQLVARAERDGPWPLAAGISPEARYYAAAVLARSGARDSARRVRESTRRILDSAGLGDAYLQNEAFVYVALGEGGAALDALERDVRAVPGHRDQIARLPWFAPLRDSARYRALLEPAAR